MSMRRPKTRRPATNSAPHVGAKVQQLATRVARAVRRRQYVYEPVPACDLSPAQPPGWWHTHGSAPQLGLRGAAGDAAMPHGWTRVHLTLQQAEAVPLDLRLYYDLGEGFGAAHSCSLGTINRTLATLDLVQFLPPGVRALRLGLTAPPDTRLTIGPVAIRAITKQEAFVSSAVHALQRRALDPARLQRAGRRLFDSVRHGGITGAVALLRQSALRADRNYGVWVRQFDTLHDGDRGRIRARVAAMAASATAPPTISVVMPVYNVPEIYLRRAIASVQKQLYPHWELCIADDCSTAAHIAPTLAAYAAQDARIKIVRRATNGHISAASNSALAMATGTFVALLDHDDELAEHALFLVAEEILAHPDVGVLYSDEDKLDDHGARHDPYFKPDWNPDLFTSQNYLSHLGVYRRQLLQDIGGFRQGYEGSQDYDLALRATERLRPQQIRHIPRVLYHWRAVTGSTALGSDAKPYAYVAAEKALNDYVTRGGLDAEVSASTTLGLYRLRFRLPAALPKVSMIIPTRDRADLLRQCIDSIRDTTRYPNFEIVVVDNQSRERRTQRLFERLEQDRRVRVFSYHLPFNFSALNNAAVRQTDGPVLAFLNNDLEVINDTWLEEMVSHALRPAIGAVGAKLYYPNRTIQHGGVLLGIGGIASHAHKHAPGASPGYFGRAQLVQNFSAVTAACMLVRRSLFDAVEGFDTALAVAYNDIDLCLRLQAKGYRNLWTPFAELLHYESASRGSDQAARHAGRFANEAALMQARWGALIANDPAYNPNLTLESEDYSCAFPPRGKARW